MPPITARIANVFGDRRQQKLTEDLEQKFADAQESRRSYEAQWMLNWAMLNGQQWHFYSKARRTLFRPRVPSWRVLHVTNFVMPNALTEYAKLMQQRPVPFARPEKSEQEAADQARACDDVLEYLHAVDGSDEAEHKAALWGIITGTALAKTYWDKDAGDQLFEPAETVDDLGGVVPNPKSGQAVTDQHGNAVRMGEVATIAVSPFEFYPQPLAETIAEMTWCFHVKVRTPEYVLEKYGLSLESEDLSSEEHLDAQMAAIAADEHHGSRKGVLVKEFWERPTKTHSDGRYVVYVKDKVLFTGPNPYERGPLPFVAYQHVPNVAHFWGQSKITQVIDPQRNYNKARSQQIEYRNLLLKGKVLIPESANITRELTSAPGEQIRYAGTQKPEFWSPPPIPEAYWRDMTESQLEIQNIFGLHEPSQGKAPAGVSTATGLALLQEQDDLRLGPTTQRREDAIADLAKLKLALVRQFYDEARTVRVVGEDQRVRVREFRKKDIPEYVDVQIKAGSTLPRSRIARQDFLRGLITEGILDKQVGLKLMELGDVEGLFDDMQRDIAHAERENERLKVGEPVLVEDFHDHIAHQRIHNRYRKGEEYEAAGPEIRVVFEQHDLDHKTFAAIALVDPTAQQAQPVEGDPSSLTPPEPPQGPLQRAMGSLQI